AETFGFAATSAQHPFNADKPAGHGLDLKDAANKLYVLIQRAALFGLDGTPDKRSAVLAFSETNEKPPNLDELRTICRQRLADLNFIYPGLSVEALPDEIPLSVALELRRVAQVNYERLLDPIRTDFANRVRSRGNKETAEGWAELAK